MPELGPVTAEVPAAPASRRLGRGIAGHGRGWQTASPDMSEASEDVLLAIAAHACQAASTAELGPYELVDTVERVLLTAAAAHFASIGLAARSMHA